MSPWTEKKCKTLKQRVRRQKERVIVIWAVKTDQDISSLKTSPSLHSPQHHVIDHCFIIIIIINFVRKLDNEWEVVTEGHVTCLMASATTNWRGNITFG